jgi:membrane associated rhomboid family serine protease
MSITRDLKMWMKGMYGSLIRLIVINCVIFLVLNIIISVQEMGGNLYAAEDFGNWIDLPSNLTHLLHRFWTPFTYMFVHYGLGHLFSNMLWLYFLGRIFCELLGSARLTATYLAGGLFGAIFYIIFYNLLPHQMDGDLKGASAGVMAVVVGVAAYSPDYMVYLRFFIVNFHIRLKWLALIAFLVTSVIDFSSNTGGKLAHIGGALFGLIYGTQLRNGKKTVLESVTSIFKIKKTHLRVEHSRSKKASDEIYNLNKIALRKRVDEILDKISRSGYDSLTKDEKEFLQKNHDKF